MERRPRISPLETAISSTSTLDKKHPNCTSAHLGVGSAQKNRHGPGPRVPGGGLGAAKLPPAAAGAPRRSRGGEKERRARAASSPNLPTRESCTVQSSGPKAEKLSPTADEQQLIFASRSCKTDAEPQSSTHNPERLSPHNLRDRTPQTPRGIRANTAETVAHTDGD